MEYEACLQIIQNNISSSPLVILGSGASVNYGLPTMNTLANVLKRELDLTNSNFHKIVDEIDSGLDLENAIDKVDLTEEEQKTVREIVWNEVNSKDIEFYNSDDITNGFPLSKLLSKISSTSNNIVTIVTTNYDRICEYAADNSKLRISNCFIGEYIKELKPYTDNEKNFYCRNRIRLAEILKVHGSLDWFIHKLTGHIISRPCSVNIPSNYSPLIIPPGKTKYQNTHLEPYRTIISRADNAICGSGSFLCIGYGFNDSHIQPKLLEEIKNGKPIVILTKQATNSCLKILSTNNINNYILIEESVIGTKVTTHKWSEEFDVSFWAVEDFIKIW